MAYLALARKWRPQTFESISGQEHSRALKTSARPPESTQKQTENSIEISPERTTKQENQKREQPQQENMRLGRPGRSLYIYIYIYKEPYPVITIFSFFF